MGIVGSHFRLNGLAYGKALLLIFSFLLLIGSIILVFYGFVGYYSRVSLIIELQKENKDANIDYVFMQLDQAERDQASLNARKSKIAALQARIVAEQDQLKLNAIASKEYQEYVTSAMAVIDYLYPVKDQLADEYWSSANHLDYSRPDLAQAEVLGNPTFKADISAEKRIELYQQIGSALQNFRYKIVYYNTKYGSLSSQASNSDATELEYSRTIVREILTRNPLWASEEDIAVYKLRPDTSNLGKDQATAQYRATVGAYRAALGPASVILQWPTIVSTMLVTLATGLLGGVVSFLGAGVRSTSSEAGANTSLKTQASSLIRSAIFGIVAALAIFLLAGSGLLVLSSQGGKNVSLASMELSPYFVAFLAFVSGFLADDAFKRITRAGRSIFRTLGTEGKSPSSGSRAAARITK